jgi:hypothetical protein
MILANLTFMRSEKPDAQIVIEVPDPSQPQAMTAVATPLEDTH